MRETRPELEAITRPSKDAIKAAANLGTREMRYLVDSYYQIQEVRKAAGNQAGAMMRAATAGHPAEPHETLDWIFTQTGTIERQLIRAFEVYSLARMPGRWLMSIPGIGPVLAANFLARLSVHPWKCTNPELQKKRGRDEPPVLPCPPDSPCRSGCAFITVETSGGFWRFAGLDPTVEWHPGELRPWNPHLKTAAWKASDSWVKLKNNPTSVYSKLYAERKAYEVARNDAGALSAQAATMLERNPKHKQRAIYAKGVLPAGQLDARARRWTVKIFLSHLHHVMYVAEFDRDPPKPYALEHGHAHPIPIPNWPME